MLLDRNYRNTYKNTYTYGINIRQRRKRYYLDSLSLQEWHI